VDDRKKLLAVVMVDLAGEHPAELDHGDEGDESGVLGREAVDELFHLLGLAEIVLRKVADE
jgi:hypothetical protein